MNLKTLTKTILLFSLISLQIGEINAVEPIKGEHPTPENPRPFSLSSSIEIISSDGVLTITTESEELISVTIDREEYLTSGHHFSINLNHLLGEEISVIIVTDRDTYNAEMSVE